MTTPTPAEIGHGSREPAVAESDGFRGRLITAGHADYDIARAIWNGAIDRRPRLIARCIGSADVVAAVHFARDHDLEIAIRGGGHNVAGTATCDDGIVIALRSEEHTPELQSLMRISYAVFCFKTKTRTHQYK